MSSIETFLCARDFLLLHRTDHATAFREFRWPTLDAFNWALDYFDLMAAGNEQPALWLVDEAGGERKQTFAEMSRRSNQVANLLRRLGVARGDRILMMLGNEIALWECMLAAVKLGAAVIPATPLLTEDDLTDRLARGKVRHVVAAAPDTVRFAHVPGDYSRIAVGGPVAGWARYEEADDENPAFHAECPTTGLDLFLLYFTSGTTSRPKLVLGTQHSYPVGHLSTMYWLGLRPGDLHFNISSPGWAKHAWSSFFAPWNAGATVFAYRSARFNARAVLDLLGRYPVTSLCAPPTVWRMLVQEDLGACPAHLREVASAGEPLNPEVVERVRRAWHLAIREGYGQTETTAVIGTPPGVPVKPGAMGYPLPGYRVVLLGERGVAGRDGEICVELDPRPLGLMLEYADAPEKNAQAMRDGYYHTGDIATVDDDGCMTYVGRTDDVFKSSDYRISPFELESALVAHPAVAEAAVVPIPDPQRLTVPKAYVTTAPGYTPGRELAGELFAFTRAHLAPFQRVRRLEFAELPKTISGKIRRVELRQTEFARGPDAPRRAMEFFEEDFAESG